MAKARKGGFSKTQAQNAIKKMDVEINNYAKALNKLKSDLDALQKGNGTTSYWSGKRAYNWIKTALGNYDRSCRYLDKADQVCDGIRFLITQGKGL